MGTSAGSALGWFRQLDGGERRTLYACFGGWAVDALDTQLYSFLIPALIVAFGMTRAEAGLLGTSALVSSAVGGWAAGILCDRIGRVRVMKLAIVWFSVCTVLSGFCDSFGQLMAARMLSGFGFGGEWAAGSVLMGEVIRPAFRGKAVGTVQSAYAVGYAAAAVLSSVLFATLPDGSAWRWMFWLGAAPAVLVFLALRGVSEPPVFVSARSARLAKGATSVSPLTIFHRTYIRVTALTSLLALGVQAGGFSVVIWLPTLLKTSLGLSSVMVGTHTFVLTTGSFVGYIAAAYLCDAIGRRQNFVVFSILNWIVIPAFLYAPHLPVLTYGLLFLLGFANLGIYSALGPYFTELFPSLIRGNGQGFAYNFGRGVGAFFPALVGAMSEGGLVPLRDAMGITASGAYLFVLVAVAFLPETQGRDLNDARGQSPEITRDRPSGISRVSA